MPGYMFVQEHQFEAELQTIEPNDRKQDDLLMRVEDACIRQILDGMLGLGCARVVWTEDLRAWYQTSGTVVYLLSIKFDLLALPRAA